MAIDFVLAALMVSDMNSDGTLGDRSVPVDYGSQGIHSVPLAIRSNFDDLG
jgi:hypothetical protein